MQGLAERRLPQNAGIPCFPRKYHEKALFPPLCGMSHPAISAFPRCQSEGDADPRHRRVGLRRRGARPAPRPRRPSRARLRPLGRAGGAGGRRRPRARRRDHRRGLAGGARRHRGRLLPDPLDGGPGRVRRRRAPPGGAVRAGRGRGRVRRIVYLGGLLPHDGSLVAPPRLAPGGRAGAAGRRAGVDRAARLDPGRRPLAVVPLPRAADRAPAGARPAGLADQSHTADRRARRARVPGPRRHAGARTPGAPGTSADRTR